MTAARTIAAFTAPGGSYPAFVNVSVLDSGEVAITTRPAGEEVDGVRVCGVTCLPDGAACNGYCRGQAPKPDRHQYIKAGLCQRVVLSPEAWEDLRAQIMADMGAVDS